MRNRRLVCITVRSKFTIFLFLLSLCLVVSENCLGQRIPPPPPAPPYPNTLFIDSDIITSADPKAFQKITYKGRSNRSVWDERVRGLVSINAYIFEVEYSDGNPFRPMTTEFMVNPEYNSIRKAKKQARKYGQYLSQLPKDMRKDLYWVVIHKGNVSISATPNLITIHTGDARTLIRDGFFEETLLHELVHVSLDQTHSNSATWTQAQVDDQSFISTYADQNRVEEDLAESFLVWFAVRYRSHRISFRDYNTIHAAIPFRLAFFDNLSLNISPQDINTNTSTSPPSSSAKLAASNNSITNGITVEPSVGNSTEATTLSTNEKELLNTKQFAIYPIPATNVLNIEFENTDMNQTTISICNLVGTIVFSKKYINKAIKTQVDLSRFERGIYSLIIEQKEEQRTQNFIIE